MFNLHQTPKCRCVTKKKLRLDELLCQRELAASVREAQALIMTGKVLVNDRKITKAGQSVSVECECRILDLGTPYVSRGGLKLSSALSSLRVNPLGRVCLDIGLSTGGFTDVLIEQDAKLVIGVDVAYGIVHHAFRQHQKIVLLEKTNARTLCLDQLLAPKPWSHLSPTLRDRHAELVSEIDLVVMDVSFISVTQVVPTIADCLTHDTDFVVLIKPQFEARKEELPQGAIIRDSGLHECILARLSGELLALGFEIVAQCESPILGAKGNKEFFFHLRKPMDV